jgi:RHH-type rel operon transcriptional repressor/antitoxin RelB
MTYSIRLPETIELRLTKLSELTGRTKAFYVKEAIIEHIDDLEDIFLAEQRYADVQSGKTKTIPLNEVMAKYDLGN